jgi:hypothetical protein
MSAVHLSANYRRHRTAHLKASMHSMQSCGLADCEEEEGREARQGRARSCVGMGGRRPAKERTLVPHFACLDAAAQIVGKLWASARRQRMKR